MNDELHRAFQETHYIVHHEPPFTMHIGQPCPELKALMAEHNALGAAYITAWNPFSIAQTKEVNESLNEQLKGDLSDYTIYDGEGKDTLGDWPPELSFFVANISKEKTKELATKYKQNAVVYGEQNKTAELLVLV
jgi:hypothetical protein